MSYPENVLAAGEQVVLHRHPHWNRLIWPVVVLVLLTGLAAFGSDSSTRHLGSRSLRT